MPFARDITRRDFLNGVLVGTGALLLGCKPPRSSTDSATADGLLDAEWYGYGGVGDFRLSHGNTPESVNMAHRLRDRRVVVRFDDVSDVEEYELVIVGAGMAGLGAALAFAKQASDSRCLMLDNHPVFGGEAKENEFEVDGVRLIGPQGANGFFVPPRLRPGDSAFGDPRYYAELGIPREFRFRTWPAAERPLRFSPDNYEYLVRGMEAHTSVGHFFADPATRSARWAVDIWDDALHGTPLSPRARQSLLRWHVAGQTQRFVSERDAMRVLDSMSYEGFLQRELGIGPEAARYADLFLASACGLGSDAVSAYAAYNLPMPGLTDPVPQGLRRVSFPGGNSGFARYFVKRIIPDAIAGSDSFEDIVTGGIRFDALDRAGQPVRMRLSSTVLSVEHIGDADASGWVNVVYARNGELRGIRARAVIMATGGWMNRYVVRDLPARHREAYGRFVHAPFLVANVALRNWRFLHRRGISAAIWDRTDDGFGFTCNIRNPMQVGDYQPPLDPDLPIILTFYTPFHRPGLPIGEQVTLGRAELLRTSYREYEQRIYRQMLMLFGDAGFDPAKDVAGLILNRWGHAFSVPYPGFYGGATDTAPRDVIRRAHGRIAFAHAELDGLQHWGPAAEEGDRAFRQVAGALQSH